MNFVDTFKQKLTTVKDTILEKDQSDLLSQVTDLDIPTKKVEAWKYTSLKELSQKNFFSPRESSANLKTSLPVLDLKENYESIKSKLKSDDFFNKINLAALTKGIYLEVPRNTDVDELVELTVNTIANEYQNILVYIRAHENSHIRIREHRKSSQGFLNIRFVLDLGPQSTCEHLLMDQNTSESFIVSTVEVHQGRSAHYRYVQLGAGANLLRQNVTCNLNGEGANAEMYGFSSLAKGLAIDNHIISNHWVPHTTSRQFFKTILNEQTHSVFQGKIFIEKDAQKSDANQLSKHLVLSQKSQVDAKPQLDVYADDVKANHGAAIGQLDADELFYLQSRGLSRDQSIQLLISAYGTEIASRLENKKLATDALQYLSENIEVKAL